MIGIVGTYLWFVCICLLAIVFVAALYFWVRLRRQARRDDSFECGYRRDVTAGWTSGVACYGASQLLWYRVVSFKWGPDLTWDRSSLLVRKVQFRSGAGQSTCESTCESTGQTGEQPKDLASQTGTPGSASNTGYSGVRRSQIVEVHCEYGAARFILAMHNQDYHALVSWLEGAPPHSDVVF